MMSQACKATALCESCSISGIFAFWQEFMRTCQSDRNVECAYSALKTLHGPKAASKLPQVP